jgi:hypothetical protein
MGKNPARIGKGYFADQTGKKKAKKHRLNGAFAVQDLLGHNSIRTTQRYCRVSNLKVQRDYFKAMEVIMQQTAGNPNNP